MDTIQASELIQQLAQLNNNVVAQTAALKEIKSALDVGFMEIVPEPEEEEEEVKPTFG